ncbi:MAG: AAA family ATPase [Pyrinomonadaceae bacterium]
MDDHELNQIVKLAGGAGFDPYKKQRKEADKLRRANDTGISPFVIQKAAAKQTTKQIQQPLYGEIWRTGEFAVLTGESGVGKSLLATQIAEVIARGAQTSINGLLTVEKPHRVIYFDFERLPDQFSRLYSCRPYPNQKYVEEYKFSHRFCLARLDICTDIPDAFNGSPDRYIRHWVLDTIAEGEAEGFIIDNIAHLSVGTTVEKVMRTLRISGSTFEHGKQCLRARPCRHRRTLI